MSAQDEPRGEESVPEAPAPRRVGLLGWLRSLRVLAVIGAALATTVLLVGVSSLLDPPTTWQEVLPFRPAPAPTGEDMPLPSAAPSASALVRVHAVTATQSPSPSGPPMLLASASPSTSPTGKPSSTTPQAVRYEAEAAQLWRGTVDQEHAGFTGTGYANFYNERNSHVQWTVPSASAGKVTLRIRFANASGTGRPVNVLVNGSSAVKGLTFPQTGDWAVWSDLEVVVALAKGSNTIRIVAAGNDGGPNIDYLEIAP